MDIRDHARSDVPPHWTCDSGPAHSSTDRGPAWPGSIGSADPGDAVRLFCFGFIAGTFGLRPYPPAGHDVNVVSWNRRRFTVHRCSANRFPGPDPDGRRHAAGGAEVNVNHHRNKNDIRILREF